MALWRKQQQLLQHNGVSPIQSARKPPKMLKEKDRFFHWIFKFAGRKKVGMLFLFAISAAVFIWVLYLGKGEDSQEGHGVHNNISVNESMSVVDSPSVISTSNILGFSTILVLPPPPPSYFMGYTLPPGYPCNSFTLPPPPAVKKRTGPCDQISYQGCHLGPNSSLVATHSVVSLHCRIKCSRCSHLYSVKILSYSSITKVSFPLLLLC